jgi:hypothetical protein
VAFDALGEMGAEVEEELVVRLNFSGTSLSLIGSAGLPFFGLKPRMSASEAA